MAVDPTPPEPPKPFELIVPGRDGTSQAARARRELDPGYVRLDERTPADFLAFAQALAAHLVWYGPDGEPDGDWRAMFAGIAAAAGPGTVGHAEAAAFAADPAAFAADPRFAALRQPHLMLLLACVRLLRHGQAAVNAIADRHYDHRLREVLGLRPAPARPERAFVLFDLAPGTAAAEAPAGLTLLAGRDARRRDRRLRLDERLVVTRARVARLATTAVDREVVDLAAACRATPRGSEDRVAALLGLVYGAPRPGNPPPPLGDEPVTARRWPALARLFAFGAAALHLTWPELRALVERKRRRDADADDWAAINDALRAALRTRTGDPARRLDPRDPRAFAANLLAAYGRDPMIGNGLGEVETLDDLFLGLSRPEAAVFVRDRLFLEPARFAAAMEKKRAFDADWAVVNGYLALAGQRRRRDPAWRLPDDAAPTDFARNLDAALGPVAWDAMGPEGRGARDPGAYLDRVAAVEGWFFLPAEKVEALFPLLDLAEPTGPAWTGIAALLAEAHVAKVAGDEQAAMATLRRAEGLAAALAEATGEAGGVAARLDALARWIAPDEVERVRAAATAPDAGAGGGWYAVDAALATARRRRLALPAPVARVEHRHALWADAFDPPGDGAPARPAFGARPADPAAAPATIGWAIASPALALSAGRRRVSLLLVFADDDRGALLDPDARGDVPLKRPFDVAVSVGAAWLDPADVRFAEERLVDGVDPAHPGRDRRRIALSIAFTLDEAAPALAPPAAGGTDPRWPALRLTLRAVRTRGRVTTAWERYRTLRLIRAELRTGAGGEADADADGTGLWPLDLETDGGRVDGKRPFEPFGPAAPPGATLAIGHPDLAGKRLTALTLRWRWQAPPADLATHYANYDPVPGFTATLALVEDRMRVTRLGGAIALFGPATAAAVRTPALTVDTVAGGGVDPGDAPVRERRRHLLLTLDDAGFGHAAYPVLAMEKAADLAAALRTAKADARVDPRGAIVRPPYTPRLRRLSLDFAADHRVETDRYDRDAAVDRLYHLHPFGTVEAPDGGGGDGGGWPLLPAHDEAGALHVGLAGVAAPETVSLLVDVPAGDGGDRPAGLRWSYLGAQGWVELPSPPRDETGGLARTGLVRIALPAAAPDARLPAGLYWLRAGVDAGAAAAPLLGGVHAQAGRATLVEADPDGATLPAGATRTIADAAAGIARVRQPYPGFGGAAPETEAAFRVRAAERLRHKNRALTAWDYERLVLARFPAVHKAKCLPATRATGPGLVRLVIVPDVRARRPADPFVPRAPVALLDEVRDHLRALAPAAARIEVGHPHFVRVRVRVGVRFRDPGDEAFQKRRLADAINRHLAPWAFGEGAEIALGQRIDAAALIAFVDGLPFVDFVAGCRLFQTDEDGDWRPGSIGGGEAAASDRPDAVLTPAPDHEIDVVTDDGAAAERFVGVGYLKIGLDLIVASTGEE